MKSLKNIRDELANEPFLATTTSIGLRKAPAKKDKFGTAATCDDIEEIQGRCDEQNDVLFSSNSEDSSPLSNSKYSNRTRGSRSDSCGSPLWTGSDVEDEFDASEFIRCRRQSRYNSTSSLYIDSTLHAPNADDVTKSIALALFYHLETGHQSAQKTHFEVFDESKYPLTKKLPNLEILPSPADIIMTLTKIFMDCLPVEVGILGLAFVERLIAKSKLTLHACNYRRVVLSAVMLACKVWEDKAVWNADFLSVFGRSTVEDMRNLESSFLYLLNYDVEVNGQLYAKYYFELRNIAESERREWPLKPLDKEAAEELEYRSQEQTKIAKRQSRRAQSSDTFCRGVSRKVLN